MENRVLWTLVVCLLALDVALFLKNSRLASELQVSRKSPTVSPMQAEYTEEQEHLLLNMKELPKEFPELATEGNPDPSARFIFLASTKDCVNCIEDEFEALNQLLETESMQGRVSAHAFFVNEDSPVATRALIESLPVEPHFPVSLKNVLPLFPEATTPLVLVVRPEDHMILDAHKPIPEDLTRRDAFYRRWVILLEPSA